MKDLEWLARNVDANKEYTQALRISGHQSPAFSLNGAVMKSPQAETKEAIDEKRAELINKPDFMKGYPWLAQDSNGRWYGFAEQPEHDNSVFFHNTAGNIFICEGEPLDNWKESLVKRPENKTLDSAFDAISECRNSDKLPGLTVGSGSQPSPELGAQEWSGEGLPLEGTVCEMIFPYYDSWQKVEILLYVDNSVVIKCSNGKYPLNIGVIAIEGELKFRPIRTPEDDMAEELECIIDQAASVGMPHMKTAELIMAAGYKK